MVHSYLDSDHRQRSFSIGLCQQISSCLVDNWKLSKPNLGKTDLPKHRKPMKVKTAN